ncbi:MAG: sterol desaturase family protein [Burkholderiales bacterium]|nr:sterol desaturase family protein [Burkholderiales bacterium]
MLETLSPLFESAVGWVLAEAVVPALFALGLMSWVEWAHEATAFVLAGALNVLAVLIILTPLERLRPAQVITDRRHVLTDVAFTLVNKLGLLPLLAFGLLTLVLLPVERWLRLQGYAPWSLEDLIPGLAAWPALSLLLYVVIIDLGEYWRHRLQHRWHWWWQLHALHHSQQQMTFWTDDRNHLLDEIIAAFWMAAIALLIGVPPAQFPLVLFATKFLESLSHANVRMSFGPLNYVLVSPRFHRMHHAMGHGHEGAARGVNFAVVFSFWDHLFGTADQRKAYLPTGIRDQLPEYGGVNYGCGFWETQWLGFQRLFAQRRRHGMPASH